MLINALSSFRHPRKNMGAVRKAQIPGGASGTESDERVYKEKRLAFLDRQAMTRYDGICNVL